MGLAVSIQALTAADVGTALGYLGSALGAAMVVPQIVRALRHRALPGVSSLAWSLTAISSFTWLLYGVLAHEAPQVPGNVITSSGAVLLALAVPATLHSRQRAGLLAACAALVLAAATVLPATALGSIGFAVGLVSATPQWISSLTRPRGVASAVSRPAWALGAAGQVCWLMFGVLRHDHLVVVSASVLLASMTLVLTAETLRRLPRAAVQAGGPVAVGAVPVGAVAVAPAPGSSA